VLHIENVYIAGQKKHWKEMLCFYWERQFLNTAGKVYLKDWISLPPIVCHLHLATFMPLCWTKQRIVQSRLRIKKKSSPRRAVKQG